MAKKNVIDFRRAADYRPRFSLPIIILFIIIIYIVMVAVNYFSKDILRIYEVNETSIADDSTLTGFILREETVIYSQESGYVNFYHADQSKVRKNEVIYTIDSSGSVSQVLEQVEADSDVSESDILSMREIIDDYYINYNPASFYQVEDFHYNIENTIFEQSRDDLYKTLQKHVSENNVDNSFSKMRSEQAGIISYSIDGFEGSTLEQINMDLFQKNHSVERKQLHSSEQVEKDGAICKLVTSEDWNIVIPVNDELYQKIAESDSVRITVKKDNVSFNTEVRFHTQGEQRFAVLSTSRFMGRYLNDRFLDIELNLNAATGFKIPNSSIVQKDLVIIPEEYVKNSGGIPSVVKLSYSETGEQQNEMIELDKNSYKDGKYYVSSEQLKMGDTIATPTTAEPYVLLDVSSTLGVYSVNTGYCKFKKIEKIYENNEYTIVSPDTKGGVSNYDHIVVNPETINENDFIE